MELSGASAIVTGAASGIGEAIAQRLLERGASVVIGDLDAARLAATASRLDADHPGRVSHVAGDASDASHVAALIEAAGEVDAFFANAGVFKGFGLEATDEEWALSWDVNVKAHVVAARALVPGWVERGGGLLRQHGVCRRSPDAAGLSDVLDDQARSCRLRGVARRDIRRPGCAGLLPVPHGRTHRHAGRGRDERRR